MGKIVNKEANKSAIQPLKKEKKISKQKDSISRMKYPKNNEQNHQYKKKLKTNINKREYVTHNSSACRSGSKINNRVIRKSSRIKTKKTGRE